MDVKYPQVMVDLTGQDGNVFSIIAIVSKAMKRHGLKTEASEFIETAFKSESYDEVLQLCLKTVDVY